jgi:L-alanine-DL-glutamate epimerase-like enolase superfamily enzyme
MQQTAVAKLANEVQAVGPMRIHSLIVHRGPVPGRDRIEVRAVNGIAGYGEGDCGEEVLRATPELLLGRSPFEVESIFDDVTHRAGRTPGGLDIALWDLGARVLETPLCRLLGKVYREEVRVYAPTAEKVLNVDGVDLIEEPFPAADLEAYRGLRGKAGALVAAGRTFPLDLLIRDFLQTRLIDVALPDIASCGLTGLRRLNYYCWIFHVRLAAVCSGSAISLAAALHAAACFVPVSRAIATPPGFVLVPETCGRNRVAVPGGPGLGVAPEPTRERPYLAIGV